MSVGKREIEEHWTIDDLLDAHAALDLRDRADHIASTGGAR